MVLERVAVGTLVAKDEAHGGRSKSRKCGGQSEINRGEAVAQAARRVARRHLRENPTESRGRSFQLIEHSEKLQNFHALIGQDYVTHLLQCWPHDAAGHSIHLLADPPPPGWSAVE